MKWYGWVLIGLLLGAGLVAAVAGSVLATRARHNAALLAADSVQSRVDALDRARLQAHGDSLVAGAAALTVQLRIVLARVAGAEAVATAGKRETDTLKRALGAQRSTADSVPVLVAIVQSQDRTIGQQDATIVDLRVSAATQEQRAAVLATALAVSDSGGRSWRQEAGRWKAASDSMRGRTVAPAPHWFGFLPPLHLKPCLFGGITTNGEARLGGGACVTL